jgi:hypothetical protein
VPISEATTTFAGAIVAPSPADDYIPDEQDKHGRCQWLIGNIMEQQIRMNRYVAASFLPSIAGFRREGHGGQMT